MYCCITILRSWQEARTFTIVAIIKSMPPRHAVKFRYKSGSFYYYNPTISVFPIQRRLIKSKSSAHSEVSLMRKFLNLTNLRYIDSFSWLRVHWFAAGNQSRTMDQSPIQLIGIVASVDRYYQVHIPLGHAFRVATPILQKNPEDRFLR